MLLILENWPELGGGAVWLHNFFTPPLRGAVWQVFADNWLWPNYCYCIVYVHFDIFPPNASISLCGKLC
jgi:hypothetical protein